MVKRDKSFAAIASDYKDSHRALTDTLNRMRPAGVALLKLLIREMSLREVGRRINRSPTYLSQVSNGIIEISPDTYLALVKLYESENTK